MPTDATLPTTTTPTSATTKNRTNMTMLDTPEEIARYYMASAVALLKIEVLTGLKRGGGSVLKMVQGRYGVKSHTKAGALDEMKALYLTTYGREYGSPNIVDLTPLDQEKGIPT